MRRLRSVQFVMIIVGILSIALVVTISANEKKSDEFGKGYEKYIMNMADIDCYFPEEGMVPDAETAKKIAEAVWLPIYGDLIHDEKPFKAKLLNDSIWLVRGTFEQASKDRFVTGGVAYAKIRKSDARILCIIHDE